MAIVIAVSANRPAHADQLGLDFGVGGIVASGGSLDLSPLMAGRVVAIYHRGHWAAEAGTVVLTSTSDATYPTGLGGSAGGRYYQPISEGRRNGVGWGLAGYASAGWTRMTLQASDPAPRRSDSFMAAGAGETRDATASGPRTGLGIELALSRGLVWSRINLEASYQTLSAVVPEGERVGGYASLQLGFVTSVGR